MPRRSPRREGRRHRHRLRRVGRADHRAHRPLHRRPRRPTPSSQTLDSGIVYSLVVPVPKPGGFQVRFAVRDATSGALGAAGEFVEMPDVKKGAFALSGVVLGAGESGAAATPETEDGRRWRSVSSPALRVFEPGRAPGLLLRDLQRRRRPSKPRVVVWRDGKPFFTRRPPPLAPPLPRSRPVKAAGGIKLGDACRRATTSSRSPPPRAARDAAKPKTRHAVDQL